MEKSSFTFMFMQMLAYPFPRPKIIGCPSNRQDSEALRKIREAKENSSFPVFSINFEMKNVLDLSLDL